jgi:hypothetical protein
MVDWCPPDQYFSKRAREMRDERSVSTYMKDDCLFVALPEVDGWSKATAA